MGLKGAVEGACTSFAWYTHCCECALVVKEVNVEGRGLRPIKWEALFWMELSFFCVVGTVPLQASEKYYKPLLTCPLWPGIGETKELHTRGPKLMQQMEPHKLHARNRTLQGELPGNCHQPSASQILT
ncbi:uncharacterized protein jph1b isoform X2 [Rhincodon typus]|uniref:uncharacterized protein jph1b isoform X2 n=1 Tax=Rhincodon typus TaxID=259920 RepID=UPI00202E15C7|nr:uncharacterized protein jph1b isoform X2 [Rhincodon typus]